MSLGVGVTYVARNCGNMRHSELGVTLSSWRTKRGVTHVTRSWCFRGNGYNMSETLANQKGGSECHSELGYHASLGAGGNA